MEPLNATAIERDKRQPKAQQMLGSADDEYVNLTDRPEPANEVRPGKPWRMLQLGERNHAARATQQSVVAQRAVQPSVAASQTGTQPAIAEGGPRQRLSLRASKLKTWQERRKFQFEYLAQKPPDPDEDSSGSKNRTSKILAIRRGSVPGALKKTVRGAGSKEELQTEKLTQKLPGPDAGSSDGENTTG